MSASQLIITDPRLVRDVLDEAERDGIWVTAVRRGLHHSTVFRWRERRDVDAAWPDDNYIARWDAAAVRRAAGRDWARGYKHDRYRGRPRKIDATGSRRRLQALYALGWTSRQLGPRLGVSYARVGHLVNGMYPLIFRSTADRIRELYDELSMIVPQDPEVLAPQQVRVHARQRRLAVARGWVPPLAWDDADLDDPQATPVTGSVGDDREVDQSVVERILAGDWRARATVAERAEVARRWHAQGRALRDLETYTGWKVERYFKVTRPAGEGRMTITGPTDTMYGAIQNNDDPTRTCRCTDPDVHRLIELINSGMSQVEASKLLWGDGGRPSAHVPAPPRVVVQRPAPAPLVTPTSAPGARFPWLRRRRPGAV